MNFTLSDEQLQIRELASGLFADFSHETRAAELAAHGWDSALWTQLLETGLGALMLPGEIGGAELGITELALVLQEQGRSLAAAPLWRHALACAALARFAPALLDGIGGSAPLALCLETRLKGRIEGQQLYLSGTVPVLAVTPESTHALLALQVNDRPALVLAELALFEKETGTLMQGERVLALTATELALPLAQLLPLEVHDWIHPRAVACIAALQLGVAEGAQAITVAHLSEREQFGRKLGSFQAVAQRMADGFIALEALRSVLLQLVWWLDAGVETGSAVAVTKYWACEAGNRMAHSAQHLHGGTGSDTSYPVHRFYLAARVLEIELGGAAAQIGQLAKRVSDNTLWGDAA